MHFSRPSPSMAQTSLWGFHVIYCVSNSALLLTSQFEQKIICKRLPLVDKKNKQTYHITATLCILKSVTRPRLLVRPWFWLACMLLTIISCQMVALLGLCQCLSAVFLLFFWNRDTVLPKQLPLQSFPACKHISRYTMYPLDWPRRFGICFYNHPSVWNVHRLTGVCLAESSHNPSLATMSFAMLLRCKVLKRGLLTLVTSRSLSQ